MKVNDLGRPLFFVARETGELMKNDPALALRTSATMLSSGIMSGVNDSVRISMEKTIVPTIRTALLALDTVRCVKTFKDADSTVLDRTMDGIRVATDLAGFIGGVAMLFVPKYANLGSTLVGAAYASDIVSHAYRGMMHVDTRVRYWSALMDEDHNNPGQNPGPKPQTPPVDPTKPPQEPPK